MSETHTAGIADSSAIGGFPEASSIDSEKSNCYV